LILQKLVSNVTGTTDVSKTYGAMLHAEKEINEMTENELKEFTKWLGERDVYGYGDQLEQYLLERKTK